MSYVDDKFTEFLIKNDDHEVVANFYAGTDEEGRFVLEGDKFSLSRADTQKLLQWLQEWTNASRD